MQSTTINNQYDESTPVGMVRWASHKAMSVLQQESRYCHYDDADQVAALALWQCRDKSNSYKMKAAYRQVMVWILEYLREASSRKMDAHFPEVIGLEDYHYSQATSPNPEDMLVAREERALSDDIAEKVADTLLEIFLAARKQQKGRAVEAAVRDVNIILLSMQGYSLEGIAFETGLPKENVSSYRARARMILEEYLVSIS